MSELRHATCIAIAIDGRHHGVLIEGPSGSGKSDLALRMIDRGAILIADDYVETIGYAGGVRALCPARIAGKLEVRGVGIVDMPHCESPPVRLVVALGDVGERLPEPATRDVAGVALPLLRLDAREASAPLKLELALRLATA